MDPRLENNPELSALLDRLKRRLGIMDEVQNPVLIDILEDAQAHFLSLSGSDKIDSKYNYILIDVADIRYNRRGSAGVSAESVDGYSVTYSNVLDDFAPYLNIIRRDFYQDGVSKGGVKFI